MLSVINSFPVFCYCKNAFGKSRLLNHTMSPVMLKYVGYFWPVTYLNRCLYLLPSACSKEFMLIPEAQRYDATSAPLMDTDCNESASPILWRTWLWFTKLKLFIRIKIKPEAAFHILGQVLCQNSRYIVFAWIKVLKIVYSILNWKWFVCLFQTVFRKIERNNTVLH